MFDLTGDIVYIFAPSNLSDDGRYITLGSGSEGIVHMLIRSSVVSDLFKLSLDCFCVRLVNVPVVLASRMSLDTG